ncbi:MAG: RraA family protein, partial [Chloroflexota bacterium]
MYPEDIVVGDDDGVVVVPKAEAAVVIAATQAIINKEEGISRDIAEGRLIPGWVNKTLTEKGCQII